MVDALIDEAVSSAGACAMACLGAIDAQGIPYVLLSGHDSLPYDVPSDLDIAVPKSQLRGLGITLDRLLREDGVRLCQEIWHESTAVFLVFVFSTPAGPQFMRLDACSDYRRNGAVWLSAEEQLEGRYQSDGLWLPKADIAFAYYLIKCLLKRSLGDTATAYRLNQLMKLDHAGSILAAERLLGAEGEFLRSMILADGDVNWTSVPAESFRRLLLRRRVGSLRRGVVGYAWLDIGRILQRIRRPTGLVVALLGPDGAGKSSIASELVRVLAPAFRGTALLHFRPGVLAKRSSDAVVVDPHAEPARGPIASFAKLVFLWCDNVIGYITITLPAIAQSRLVLFDRYLFDLEVDPIRYRHGLSRRLTRLITRRVPAPAVTVVLVATCATIRSRKCEVSQSALETQLWEYAKLADELPNGHTVDTGGSLADTVRTVSQVIVQAMIDRVSRD